ncbi:MAG: hypothetical protein CM1200mP26_21600 [Acidimicrobiales bacterium]|nr:MAG: hypothetical protein CM1200mP26_21600 [Acidimicrobiales bacterium]
MLLIQRPTVTPVDDAVDNRQQFSIEPLEPGFGHTLGNSLRRTLLSSIPGAAVTEVRFDDALHEFGTIEGWLRTLPTSCLISRTSSCAVIATNV